jgi:hypothetical protein
MIRICDLIRHESMRLVSRALRVLGLPPPPPLRAFGFAARAALAFA